MNFIQKEQSQKHLLWRGDGGEYYGLLRLMIKRKLRLLWKGAQLNGEGPQKSKALEFDVLLLKFATRPYLS